MSEAQSNMTVIGQGTHIKGEMSFDRTARILGSFEGKVSSAGEIQIGDSALCKADVEAATVLVDGTVEGNIIATDRVQLNAGAKVVGDITAPTMIVASGATIIGACRVGGQASAKADKARAPKAETAASAPAWDIQTRADLDAVMSGYGDRAA